MSERPATDAGRRARRPTAATTLRHGFALRDRVSLCLHTHS
ncbi:hypothetical protein P376_3250 [Streptomyces sp. HCCB10043]|nr:hypothetical protein P376_3250 [Streptomyces sp. HCCB10043]